MFLSFSSSSSSLTKKHCTSSVTKQYNLVPAKRVICLAGKVTVGLVEGNGRLMTYDL